MKTAVATTYTDPICAIFKTTGDEKMKKQNLVMCLVVIILAVSGIFAQDSKMDMKMMDMTEMMKSPHKTVMMAYRQNALSFARVLWDLSSDGKIEDVDLARNAFAELKRSMEKMDEIHKSKMIKMDKMSPEMTEKMKPMMEKMNAEKAAVMVHINALEKALQANSPNAQEVEMHSAALVMQFEKMKMPVKMKM